MLARSAGGGGGGGGEREPVPSRLQLVGEGSDIDVLESSSSDERPGDNSEPCTNNILILI
jgi:hypothetical protein